MDTSLGERHSGWDILEAIKSNHLTKDTPVLVYTDDGRSVASKDDRLLRLLDVHVLEKGGHPAALLAKVAEILGTNIR